MVVVIECEIEAACLGNGPEAGDEKDSEAFHEVEYTGGLIEVLAWMNSINAGNQGIFLG